MTTATPEEFYIFRKTMDGMVFTITYIGDVLDYLHRQKVNVLQMDIAFGSERDEARVAWLDIVSREEADWEREEVSAFEELRHVEDRFVALYPEDKKMCYDYCCGRFKRY